MKKHRLLAMYLAVCMTVPVLSGCQAENSGPGQEQGESKETVQTKDRADSMEAEPVLEYEVPVIPPGVLVSHAGYQVSEEKQAVFQGAWLPKEFYVADAATGCVIYTGKIEQSGYNGQTKEYTGYGEFTSLETEGEYYIECERIGRSYTFAVREELYAELMTEAVGQLYGQDGIAREDIAKQCDSLAVLMLAYELFPQVQADGVQGAENEIPDLLEYVAEQVKSLAERQSREDGSLGADTAWYCAVLTKFSYLWQKYDSAYATGCLQAADKAWKYVKRHEEEFQPSERFFAAAELYRVTGKYSYCEAANELGQELLQADRDEAFLCGGITYISTKRKVDVDFCNSFLDALMEDAGQIAKLSRENAFGVAEDWNEKDVFWKNMTVMSVVNYVITNHEYAAVIKNHFDYLMGRNPEGRKELLSDVWKDPVYMAKYLLILSEISSHE